MPIKLIKIQHNRLWTLIALILFLNYGFVQAAESNLRITSITDGDTIKLSDGTSVRLLQIDSPELRGNECYATEAQKALAKLINRSGKISLTTDPNLDEVDRYGRLLRYLFIGKRNINLEMVRVGAAAPYFYRSERGLYSEKLIKAAQSARANSRGLWSACPNAKLEPNRALTTN
jgi:micrococcal nuclease